MQPSNWHNSVTFHAILTFCFRCRFLFLNQFCSMASHGQHFSHGTKTTLKKSGSSLPLQSIFQNRIFQNYLNCIEKGQKEHTKCYMISNPTPKFTCQIRSIRPVFGRNRTGTGSEKIDRIDRNRNRNRISGRMMINHSTLDYHVTNFNTFSRWLWRKN